MFTADVIDEMQLLHTFIVKKKKKRSILHWTVLSSYIEKMIKNYFIRLCKHLHQHVTILLISAAIPTVYLWSELKSSQFVL